MGSKFTHNALAAGAPLPTPLGELKRSPRPDFRGPLRGRGKGKEGKREEGKGKGILGKGNRKRREEEREGKGKEEGTGGEGKLASLALGGIDAPENGDDNVSKNTPRHWVATPRRRASRPRPKILALRPRPGPNIPGPW